MPQQRNRWDNREGLCVITVNFITHDGETIVASVEEGTVLLEAGQAVGMPLEGTCEGQMACSTCHVVVAAEWFGKLPAASADEEDMLDLATGVTRNSRLACQIRLTAAMDGMDVHIPGESRDMRAH